MYSIVGREYVLSVLTGYLDATVKGTGACVLLEGSIGMGKSRLLRSVALEGAERGLAVTYIRAGSGDEGAIVRELIIFLRHVTRGEVEFHDREFQDLVRPDANPFLVADGLSEMIGEAARRRPLLIILDDAQEVDDFSSVALQGLMRSLAASPVLCLLARRPVPAHSLAQHAIGWLCEHAAVHLRLGPLDDEAVTALCANALGAKPDASVLAWAARCGGNPWLLKTVMSALMEAGRLVIVDGTASVLAESMPENVLSAVHRLLDSVPPGVRRLLLQGGRIGPEFTVEDAAALPGESPSDLSSCVDEAVQVGLVRRSGEQLRFVHEVVGEAMQHAAGMNECRAAIARPAITAPACGCQDVAGRVVSALGDMLEAPRRLARSLCLLAGAGRGEEASHLAEIAVRAGLDTAAEAHLVLELVPGLQNAGCHTMSIEHLRRTLTRRDLRETDRTKLELLLTDTAERVKAIRTSGGALIVPHRADPDADRLHCEVCGCPSWAWMIRALIAADQFEEASAVAAAIKQAAQTHGETWSEPQWHAHRAELLATLGRLSEARIAAETGLRLSGRSMAGEDTVPARAVLAEINLHLGDPEAASEHLRMAERLTAGAGADKTRLDWALAQYHAACGHTEVAVQSLLNVEARVAPDMLLFVEAPTAAATLVRLARSAGLGAEAECAADLARRVTELNPDVASLAGGAEHAEGLLRRDPEALRRAVEYYRLSGRPLATGSALEDTAQHEHDSSHKPQAVELLESALDLYVQCDARQDVSRVQRKLRVLGVNRGGRHGADRPTSGWESLTGAELRVVRAIVDGKTNKEAASALFLSPHTVDSHLRRVFGKLGINTRVELTKHFLSHEAA